MSSRWPAGVTAALGEAAEGFDGWRLTHSQAQDAHLVSLRRPQCLTRYADVALIVPWLRDPARARWLIETYLTPLDRFSSGDALRDTLRTYFLVGRNASEAARRLSISRRTMRNRMVMIDNALGALLDTCQGELDLTLRLHDLIRHSDLIRSRAPLPT